MYLLKKLNVLINSCFFCWMVVEIFELHLYEFFMAFSSIICPRNFTVVRKKCDLSGTAFRVSSKKN